MQNEPANFVEYASTVKGGLERMKKLGVADRIEYGLAGDSASGKLMILKGTKTEVALGISSPWGTPIPAKMRPLSHRQLI